MRKFKDLYDDDLVEKKEKTLKRICEVGSDLTLVGDEYLIGAKELGTLAKDYGDTFYVVDTRIGTVFLDIAKKSGIISVTAYDTQLWEYGSVIVAEHGSGVKMYIRQNKVILNIK